MKTTTVRARIEPSLKNEVEPLLAELGLSVSDAIVLFLRQVKLNQGIPFAIRIPNEVTLKTLADTDKGKNLARHKDSNEMFKKLGIK